MANKTLIVVDMQNDFVTGSLANPAAQEIIPFIKSEIESGKYSNILFTQDTHTNRYLYSLEGRNLPVTHCVQGTYGWEIVKELRDYATEGNTIWKPTFGFAGWWHDEYGLLEADEIVIVGTCTDICVVSNALIIKALWPEKPITVLANGCAGVTPEKHAAALETMRSCQINVVE